MKLILQRVMLKVKVRRAAMMIVKGQRAAMMMIQIPNVNTTSETRHANRPVFTPAETRIVNLYLAAELYSDREIRIQTGMDRCAGYATSIHDPYFRIQQERKRSLPLV